jgi:hypothetical protein
MRMPPWPLLKMKSSRSFNRCLNPTGQMRSGAPICGIFRGSRSPVLLSLKKISMARSPASGSSFFRPACLIAIFLLLQSTFGAADLEFSTDCAPIFGWSKVGAVCRDEPAGRWRRHGSDWPGAGWHCHSAGRLSEAPGFHFRAWFHAGLRLVSWSTGGSRGIRNR